MGSQCMKAKTASIVKKTPQSDISVQQSKGSHEAIFESMEKINIFKFFNIQDVVYLFLKLCEKCY